MRSWASWDPSPGSLWGVISGCPTESPVTGKRMGASQACQTEEVIQDGGSSPSQSERVFPGELRKVRSLTSMDKGQPASLAT